MAVNLLPDGTIELQGDCALEDADQLLQALINQPTAVVDWRQCSSAHTALIQVLLAANPVLRGPPGGEALRSFVAPLLSSEGRSTVAKDTRR